MTRLPYIYCTKVVTFSFNLSGVDFFCLLEMNENNHDLEKKFKEDLERAEALSLESLALEKFRLQKLEKDKGKGFTYFYLLKE